MASTIYSEVGALPTKMEPPHPKFSQLELIKIATSVGKFRPSLTFSRHKMVRYPQAMVSEVSTGEPQVISLSRCNPLHLLPIA